MDASKHKDLKNLNSKEPAFERIFVFITSILSSSKDSEKKYHNKTATNSFIASAAANEIEERERTK
jgi:hypothetical protein